MSKITAKYWGHEDEQEDSVWHIAYEADTLAECWKKIMFDGLSSDDYMFVEEE